ncbi:ribosome maturation factor RimM [Okibacterium endophyticum]
MSTEKPSQTQLRVGRLTKAHGLKGAIKLELYTDDPDTRFVPGAVFTLQVPSTSPWHGTSLTLKELRWYNAQPVGFFEGVDDRTTAESLAKGILWIDHDPNEASTEEDAWFDHQLIGLDVLRDGVSVGSVARVDHLPAQDLLIVKTANGEVMVPFVKAIVPSVDVEARTVTITPPLGLFEELPSAAETEAEPGTDHTGGDAPAASAAEPDEPATPDSDSDPEAETPR